VALAPAAARHRPRSVSVPRLRDTLALAFQKESELFFDSIVREDRPASDLLDASYTFVNERLAQHYGIPNVKGVNFRRVELADDSPRRGLLGKGSILTVTALPNRTSPVVRGKWVLQNILGRAARSAAERAGARGERQSDLEDAHDPRASRAASRQRGVRVVPQADGSHWIRAGELDAIGKYRRFDENYQPIDNSGVYADGTRIDGLAGLRLVLMNHSQQFLTNLTNTLMTYALGRGVEYYDAPAVRAILRNARSAELPSLIAHCGHRLQRAISDEESRFMIVTKRKLSRRTVLRGFGVSLALPLLDAMVPALAGTSAVASAPSRSSGTGSTTCRTAWR